jgi:photosystem II stability/assembly factor-like uncharacterized protein
LRAVRARLALLALLVLGGCGGDEAAETTAESTPTPNPTIEAEPSEPGSAANAFIGSLAVDPGDGTLMIGTGLGLFRAEQGARKAERVTGELTTPDGSGPVSSNLVVRFAKPGELLGSGHPDKSGTPLPEDLGLMRSGDAGSTWEPISALGNADYHLLQARGDHVVAVRAEETDIGVSTDGGRSFEARTAPDLPRDVAFDPEDPQRMLVATAQGTFSSSDGGRSWRPRDPIPSEQLAWGAADAVYRADPGGLIKVSGDGGASWKDRGNVGLPVNELAVDDEGTLYASVPGGEVHRSTDGGATWRRLLRLE